MRKDQRSGQFLFGWEIGQHQLLHEIVHVGEAKDASEMNVLYLKKMSWINDQRSKISKIEVEVFFSHTLSSLARLRECVK